MYEVPWGLPVVGYLFLAGVGAGALTVSSSVLLRGGGGGFGGAHFKIARYGALIAPILLIVGTGLIVLELGTFEAAIVHGEWAKLFRWINLFLIINLSPMSIGSWALAVTILASIAYAYTFLRRDAHPGDDQDKLRRGLAWVGVPLGISVAIYTGVLLGAMPARPLWNSPVLALLFLLSALSTGMAAIIVIKSVIDLPAKNGVKAKSSLLTEEAHHLAEADTSGYLLATSDLILIGFELLAVFLFIMFAHLTIGAPAVAMKVLLPGGELAALFWFGVVAVGLVLPVLVELKFVLPTLLHRAPYAVPVGIEVGVGVLILLGGFMLRYVIVIAGQITGPIGI